MHAVMQSIMASRIIVARPLKYQFCRVSMDILLIALVVALPIHGSCKPSVPALIVFGDSTVDPGNNNHIRTIVKSNFPPYGKDFVGHRPTGRFCNGKLPTDFIAEELGIKETVPAYLDPGLRNEDLLTGVSFASAGTGYDNTTAQTVSVIPMWKELEYFDEYITKLKKVAGEGKARKITRQAIYIVSVGSNDFIENYYVNPYRQLEYTVSQFQDHLIQISAHFLEPTCYKEGAVRIPLVHTEFGVGTMLQEMYSKGARRIGIAGIPPLGCLPLERTLRLFRRGNGCVDDLNQDAAGYNIKLQKMIESQRIKHGDLRIVYLDIYSQLIDMEQNPSKYDIKFTRKACCGTGLVEFGYACNRRTPLTCSDASQYIFWDAFHPTEKAYKFVAQDLVRNYIPKLLGP